MNRRRFLKSAGVASAAAAVPSSGLWTPEVTPVIAVPAKGRVPPAGTIHTLDYDDLLWLGVLSPDFHKRNLLGNAYSEWALNNQIESFRKIFTHGTIVYVEDGQTKIRDFPLDLDKNETPILRVPKDKVIEIISSNIEWKS